MSLHDACSTISMMKVLNQYRDIINDKKCLVSQFWIVPWPSGFCGNLFLLSFSRTILARDFSGFSHLTMCQLWLLNYWVLQWAKQWNLWWHLMQLSGINLAIHEVQAVQKVGNTLKVILVKLCFTEFLSAPSTLPPHLQLWVWLVDTSFHTVGIAQYSVFAFCLLSINPHHLTQTTGMV